MGTLAGSFDPRRNAFDVLRLIFAVTVAVTHGMDIHTGAQPVIGNTSVGDLALDGFFILSGYLVTRSFLRLDSPLRYLWHRFLRIMPGFWVCLLVIAFVVAPAAAALHGMPATTAFTEAPSAMRFVMVNAGLLMVQYEIGGILDPAVADGSFNGALWTLFFEAACYALVLGLGVLGLLRRHRWSVLVVTGAFAALTVAQEAGAETMVNDRVLRLGFVFLLGVVAYRFGDRIPAHGALAGPAVVVFGLGVALFEDYRVLGAAPLAYVFLWLGARRRLSWSMRHDVSYGMYIYHWPVQQVLNLTVLSVLPTALFVGVGLLATLPLAVASWFLVERRAMGWKNVAVPELRRRPGGGVPAGAAKVPGRAAQPVDRPSGRGADLATERLPVSGSLRRSL
ncbi:acyltransferase [Pseudonocardia sp. NPDC049635]|uniref:acyltransferase family protein n=1 Tax=Pseudonocardia sp. NPDC049635 TaxID=3155506 RepID=UPI0033C59459